MTPHLKCDRISPVRQTEHAQPCITGTAPTLVLQGLWSQCNLCQQKLSNKPFLLLPLHLPSPTRTRLCKHCPESFCSLGGTTSTFLGKMIIARNGTTCELLLNQTRNLLQANSRARSVQLRFVTSTHTSHQHAALAPSQLAQQHSAPHHNLTVTCGSCSSHGSPADIHAQCLTPQPKP